MQDIIPESPKDFIAAPISDALNQETLQVVQSDGQVIQEEKEQEEIVRVEVPRMEDLNADLVDPYGFKLHADQQAPSHTSKVSLWHRITLRQPDDLQEYRRRESKWIKVVSQWHKYRNDARRWNEIKLMCRAGIPVSLRGRVWQLLLNVDAMR